jgi:outer membrane receptor protein involved in Fe transport
MKTHFLFYAKHIDDELEYGAANAKRLPEYHRLDFSAIYQFNFNKTGNWKGQIGASIQNLYNRQVPVSISYRVDDNAITEERRIRQVTAGIPGNEP